MVKVRICPHCGEQNLPQRGYCRVCGESLQVRCPACGFGNKVGDRYCGGCGESLLTADGHPLAPWRAGRVGEAGEVVGWPLPAVLADNVGALDPAVVVASENRLATIVKADLSGFTAMSELLGDPEEVTVIMNQVFDPLVACVRRYEGYIDNYAGDMIISFFGTPTTLEDGAERAVRAALEMRSEVARLNERNISHGVDLGISTGVATGYGLWSEVGFGASTKKTISGELGDYAALLEKYADRGTVGICPDTYRRVRQVIPATEQPGRVHRPGETEELPLYYAELPRPRLPWLATAAAEAGMGRRIGDGLAWRVLTDAWSRCEAGLGQAVALSGEAGVGKTRLLLELAQTVLSGGARVYAVGGRPLTGALGDDWQRDLRHAMLAAEGIQPEDTERRSSWLHSLGLPPRSSDVAAWIRAKSAQGPVLLLLDGLDWLTANVPATVQSLADCAVLVVGAARQEAAFDGWRLPAGQFEAVTLGCLTPDEAAALADEAADRPLPAETQEWLWQWSEGNPLFVRQFVELLEELPAPVDLATTFRWLPPRVQEQADLLLDAVGEHARAVALAASCATDEELAFEPAVVAWQLAMPDWSAALRRLEAVGLLQRTGDLTRLQFRHRAVWWAAQARCVESIKQQLTARAAEARARLGAS